MSALAEEPVTPSRGNRGFEIPTPPSERVRRAQAAELSDPIPEAEIDSIKISADRSVLDGLVHVVEHCSWRACDADAIMPVTREAEQIFYHVPAFKMDYGDSEVAKNFEQDLISMLENKGTDDCGQLTLQELERIWDIGVDNSCFLNKIGAHRVRTIAKSQGTTDLAVWALDLVFSGVLHPVDT